MSGKIKLRISPAVAGYVRPDAGSDEKLRAVEASALFPPVDRVTLLFCLMRDADGSVKGAASAVFAELADDVLLTSVAAPGLHPAILDAITRVHYVRPAVAAALLENPELSPEASAFLSRRALSACLPPEAADEPCSDDGGATASPPGGDESSAVPLPEDEFVEGDENCLSKYQMIQRMGIGEKIKMALTGDKEWRAILVNDSNKLVSGSVIKNPRITEGEILQFLKVGVQNDEIIRLICANREWVKNCQIRKALVDCPKTPLPNALRFLATLGEKDIAAYAKSKNISTVISTQAKRLMLAKKK